MGFILFQIEGYSVPLTPRKWRPILLQFFTIVISTITLSILDIKEMQKIVKCCVVSRSFQRQGVER